MELTKMNLGQFLQNCTNEQAEEIAVNDEFKKSADILNLGDITECSFGLIKEILMDMEGEWTFENQYEALRKIMLEKANNVDLLSMNIVEFIQQLNYMKDCMNAIVKNEIELLSNSDFDEIAERAVIGDNGKSLFEGIEVYLQLRQLANDDITKIDKIEKMKYCDCFLELYTRNQLNKFESNYNKIAKLRHK